MSIIIVTGASTGIGFETALHLGRAGHRVYAGVRNPGNVSELDTAIGEENLPVEVIQLDITDQASVDSAIAAVMDKEGRIDALVNNAGIGAVGAIEEMPLDTIRELFDTNYIGTVRAIDAVAPIMRSQGSGHIINVTSSAAKIVAGTNGHYSATKWALEGMSEALAFELAEFGVKVAIVEPGVTVTPMAGKMNPPPEDTPYGNVYQRLGRLFEHAFKNPAMPVQVAVAIQNAIENPDAPFRTPVGEEANEMINARLGHGEEEWVRVNCLQGEEFYDAWLKIVGKDYFRW